MKKLGVSPEENSVGLGLVPDPAAVLQDDPGSEVHCSVVSAAAFTSCGGKFYFLRDK